MAAKEQNLLIYHRKSRVPVFSIEEIDIAVEDIVEIRWGMAKRAEYEPLIKKKHDGIITGEIEIDTEKKECKVFIKPEDTEDILPSREYYHELQVIDAYDNKITAAEGIIFLKASMKIEDNEEEGENG